jgi:hypothetical protein
MVTAKEIEIARRAWVAVRGTKQEASAKSDLLVLIAQAKRDHAASAGRGAS